MIVVDTQVQSVPYFGQHRPRPEVRGQGVLNVNNAQRKHRNPAVLVTVHLINNLFQTSTFTYMIPSMFYAAPVALALTLAPFLSLSLAATTGRRATICNGFSEVRAHYTRCHIGRNIAFVVLRKNLRKHHFCRCA
jgi:hypothetical protein